MDQSAAYKLLKARPISVNPVLIRLTKSHTSAIFLAQAIYWEETMGREFYKTNDSWQEELCMSEQVFISARTKAKKYISIIKKGLPAKNYYTINWEVLLQDIATLSVPESKKTYNNTFSQYPPKLGSLDTPETGGTITETTTKTNNTTNVVLANTPKSYGNEEINDMFDLWEKDLGYRISGKKQANRRACYNLIRSHGVDGVQKLIRILVVAQKEKYSPGISDFSSLQFKLNDLLLWAKKKGSSYGKNRY